MSEHPCLTRCWRVGAPGVLNADGVCMDCGRPSGPRPPSAEVLAERAAIVAYLKDRAEWLSRERFRGGAASLAHQENECRALAKMIAAGRHHKGGHR